MAVCSFATSAIIVIRQKLVLKGSECKGGYGKQDALDFWFLEQILLRRCGSNNGVWGLFDSIVIPPSAELIFNDQDLTLQTYGIIVEGKLTIGSPSCRLHSNIEIELFGSKSELNFEIVSFLDDISKGVVTKNGGEVRGSPGAQPSQCCGEREEETHTLRLAFDNREMQARSFSQIDIHGKRYHPTWTRLASSLTPGTSFIRLQDEVNWEVGQEIVVTTSLWKDEEDNQNEVLTITGVDASRTIIEVRFLRSSLGTLSSRSSLSDHRRIAKHT